MAVLPEFRSPVRRQGLGGVPNPYGLRRVGEKGSDVWGGGRYSITPEPTNSSPSYQAANCPGVMLRWGSSKQM